MYTHAPVLQSGKRNTVTVTDGGCGPIGSEINYHETKIKKIVLLLIYHHTITLSLPGIIMQELEIFLLTEFWVQMVKLLLTVMDTN